MKKILFLQNKSNSIGGIWSVNQVLAHQFMKKGYEVELAAIRKNPGNLVAYDDSFKITCINNKDLWEIKHFSELKQDLKNKKIFDFLFGLFKRLIDGIKLKRDFYKMKRYIKKYNPDYIISTHYQLLESIPKKYLSKTIHEQHTSFNITKTINSNIKTFNKYKDKINFVWLTKSTCDAAIEFGYFNSKYIYNPVKFTSDKISDVVNNKKLVTITRLSEEKKIDEMIEIVNKIFENKKYKDWSLEIYGDGDLKNKLLKLIKNKEQIKLMGYVDNIKKVYESATLNLNTSIFEGLPMSILEANECGVPTISFNYGESAHELINNNVTGIVVENRDKKEYIKQLQLLMEDSNKLSQMSKACKNSNKKFNIDNIINKWIKLFKEIDGR